MSESPRRRWLALLSVALSVALLWLLFRQIDAARLGSVLARADPPRLSLAVCVSLAVNLVFSSLALRHALAAHGVKLARLAAIKATLGHLALHAGATWVVGKPARALYLSRAHGLDMQRALGAEVSLLVLKVAALLGLAAVGALLEGALWLVPGVALLLFGLIVWGRRRGAEPGALSVSLGWSLVMGLGQIGVFALALSGLGAALPLARVFALFPLCLLAAKVPVSLMGLGVRESLVVVLFQGAGAPEALLGASLIFSLVEQVLPGLLGLAFAPRFVARALRG